MLLSLWMIAKDLDGFQVENEICSGELTIRDVRMQKPEEGRLAADRLYIWGDGTAVFLRNGADRLTVSSGELPSVFNRVLETFERFYGWERELRDAVADHAPLQRIVDLCEPMFGQPMFINDGDGHLLAISRGYTPVNDPEWEFLVKERTSPVSAFTSPLWTADGTVVKDMSLEPTHYLRRDGENYLGFYWGTTEEITAACVIREHGEMFRPWIFQTAKVFQQILAESHYFTGSQSPVVGKAAVLSSLLLGKEISGTERRKLLAGNRTPGPWVLLIFQNVARGATDIQHTITLRMARKLRTGNVTFVFEQNLVGFVSESQYEEYLAEMSLALNKNFYSIGVSLPCFALDELSTAYRQALFALKKGEEAVGVHRCAEYAFEQIMSYVNEHNTPLNLLHPDLGVLRAYDTAHGTAFYETLFVFLSHERNLVKTANALYIHRNSLVYRVKRIEELIKADLNDPQERMYLLLSFYLCREKP